MATLDPRLILAQQPAKIPDFDMSQAFVNMARLRAYQQSQRLEEMKLGQLERAEEKTNQWQMLAGQLFSPEAPAQGPGAGGLASQPQGPAPAAPPPAAPPGAGGGLTGPLPAVEPGSPYETIPNTPEGRSAMAGSPDQGGLWGPGVIPPEAPGGTQGAMIAGDPGLGGVPPEMAQRIMPQVTPPPPQGGLTGQPAAPQAAAPPPPAAGLGGSQPQPQKMLTGLMNPMNQKVLMQMYALDPVKTEQMHGAYLKNQKDKLEQVASTSDQIYQVLQAVEKSDNPAEMWPKALETLKERGIPIPDSFPKVYNPAMLKYKLLEHRSLDREVKEAQAEQARGAAEYNRMHGKKLQHEIDKPSPINYGLGDVRDSLMHATFGERLAREKRQPNQQEVATINEAFDAREISQRVKGFVGEMPHREKLAEITGAAAEKNKPLAPEQQQRFSTMIQSEGILKQLMTEFTPEERAKYVGAGGLRMGAQELQQLLDDVNANKPGADKKFARFSALVNLMKAEVVSFGGKSLTDGEKDLYFGFIPTGQEWSAAQFEEKLKLSQKRIPEDLDRQLKIATTPRGDLPAMRQRGDLTAKTGDTITQATFDQLAEKYKASGMTPDQLKQKLARDGITIVQ